MGGRNEPPRVGTPPASGRTESCLRLTRRVSLGVIGGKDSVHARLGRVSVEEPLLSPEWAHGGAEYEVSSSAPSVSGLTRSRGPDWRVAALADARQYGWHRWRARCAGTAGRWSRHGRHEVSVDPSKT